MNKLKEYMPESLRRYFRLLQSFFAAAYYGFPAKKLKLIGVTGTSGKSTTSNMIYFVLRENDYNVGVISTVGALAGKKLVDTGLHVTTPDPIDMQRYLKYMVDRGMEYVVLECSSHALAQGRLGQVKFDYSVITNIKSDHLDWHGSWENYAIAKSKIGLKTKPSGKVVLNRDDKKMYDFVSSYLKSQKDESEIVTYSINELQEYSETATGLRFTLSNKKYDIPILGEYNIQNALATINVCGFLGLGYREISSAFGSFKGLIGRMQIMHTDPLVVVDYAHNTDSLVKSLQSAKKLVKPGRKLITVFGSAGQRDIEKRYTMGETSAEIADITVITSEDPRTEKLFDINSQIIDGATKKGGILMARFGSHDEFVNEAGQVKNERAIRPKAVFTFDEETVDSRYDAIEFAISIAKPGDVVITEGKGHELSLCFGEIEYPFTDQEAVQRALKNLGMDKPTSPDQ